MKVKKTDVLNSIQRQMNMNQVLVGATIAVTAIIDGLYLSSGISITSQLIPNGGASSVASDFGILGLNVVMWLLAASFQDKALRFADLYEKVASDEDEVVATMKIGSTSAITKLATLWSVPVGLFYVGAIATLILPSLG